MGGARPSFMTLREAKSALAGRWPTSSQDEEWLAKVDAVGPDQLWRACASGAAMVLALLYLKASRRICARAVVACLHQLASLPEVELPSAALSSLERLAAGLESAPDAHTLAREACEEPTPADRGAQGLAQLALSTAIGLLDPTDAAPLDGAEIDCIADALYAGGAVASLPEARARMATAIREEIPRLASLDGLDLTVGEVPSPTDDDLPF